MLLMCAFALTAIETMAVAALASWSRTDADVALVAGVAGFALLGWVFGLCMKAVAHLGLVSSMWQSVSTVVVALASQTLHGDHLSSLQWAGVLLAACASLCFLYD